MLTIYSLTNGRSTHRYSIRSLGDTDCILIKNKDFTSAFKTCLNTCQTEYFLTLDDDMFLHPKALEYIEQTIIRSSKTVGMFFWYLWEDYTQSTRQCIRVYRTDAVKDIGGFKFLSDGKTGAATLKVLRDSGWLIHEDKSILAIHARGTLEETIEYYNLWKVRSKTYRKQGYKESLKYNRSVEYQYSLRDTFLTDLNIKEGTSFAKCHLSST